MRFQIVRRLLLAVVLLALGGGCITSKPHVVARSRLATSASLPAGPWMDHTVGDTATTGAGNRVTVHQVVPNVPGATTGPLPAAGVDVEVCVRNNGSETPFDRDLFRVQVERSTRLAIPTGRAASPSLDGITKISAGRCIRGWLLFLLERGERPDAVLLLASSPIRWHLDRQEP